MAIPKVMGTETEYGIAASGQPDFNPVLSSSMLISAYAGSLRKIRWDYEDESPMRDARGFEPQPGREMSDEDLGLANVILPNGARYYVDHAHPEYSTPECLTPRDLVIHDKAGERILERSLEVLASEMPQTPALSIYKNNSDGKGNSYGTHENYLVDRATPFADIVRDLTPFFVTRQVFTGAGKVGYEGSWDDRTTAGYQLTARADFFETEVGLETTLKRPIINTRDEPHADPEKYRRLHVIVGDANRCEVAQFLKMGTTAIVLKMIEDGFLPDFSLVEPVSAIHAVSRDLDLVTEIELTDGRRMTAVQLQSEYLEIARKYVDREDDTPANREVIQRWESVIDGLVADLARPFYAEGPPTAPIHQRLLDAIPPAEKAGFGPLLSYRAEGRPSMQIVIAIPPVASAHTYADIDLDLGNPLQDALGVIVHAGELLDGKETNHLDLRKELARGRAVDFLYYTIV